MAGTIVANTLNTDTGVFSTNNAYGGICNAWVCFGGGNGTTAGAINASYNVSSVTYTATAIYQINFTNAFVDTNYCPVSGCNTDFGNVGGLRLSNSPSSAPTNKSTTSCTVTGINASSGANQTTYQCNIAFFR